MTRRRAALGARALYSGTVCAHTPCLETQLLPLPIPCRLASPSRARSTLVTGSVPRGPVDRGGNLEAPLLATVLLLTSCVALDTSLHFSESLSSAMESG